MTKREITKALKEFDELEVRIAKLRINLQAQVGSKNKKVKKK